MKYSVLAFGLLLFSAPVFAQIEIKEPPPVHQNTTPEYYQIFLNEPIKEIQRAIYKSDGVRIKTEITDDGSTIKLMNYKGRNTVSVLVKYADGRVEEIVKPSCHIVPYPYPKKES